MTVSEAEREIHNIEETIKAIHKLTALNTKSDVIDNLLEEAEINMLWSSIALHSVNSMCAYKNILKDKIKNAVIN